MAYLLILTEFVMKINIKGLVVPQKLLTCTWPSVSLYLVQVTQIKFFIAHAEEGPK